MFQGPSGLFVTRGVILFSVLLHGAVMRVSRGVVQFSGALVVLVVRSVVIASGHYRLSIRPD